MKKKIFSFLTAICLLLPCAFTLTACKKDDDTSKVMNINLNPEVEFVLNKENKVVSVNALDDDGNHIVSLAFNAETAKSAFEGLTAEEAAELFLDLAEQNGYLITGDEEEISIKISGEADKLLNKVKEKAQTFFNQNNLSVDITTGKVEKSEIIEQVKGCLKEYTDSQLNEMSQEELIELLKNSRKETADLFTQELKDAYYNMRAEKLNTAELEKLYDLISNDQTLFYEQIMAIPGVSDLVENLGNLLDEVDDLEEVYKQYYLTADSDPATLNYYEAKQAYVTAKEDLLKQRLALTEDGVLSEADKTALVSYEEAVNTALTNIETAEVAAKAALDQAKLAITQAMSIISQSETLIASVKTFLTNLHINLDSIHSAANNMLDGFKNHFKTEGDLKDFVGKHNSHWSQEPLQPAE